MNSFQVISGHNIEYSNEGLPIPLKLDPIKFRYLGENVTIWPQSKLINTSCISIGHHSIIDDFVLIIAAQNGLSIGKFVHIASFCSITGKGGAILQDFSGLAAGVRIATSDEDYAKGTSLTNPTIFSEFRSVRHEQVTLEKHAIVGTNSVILPGVTIGKGCAVGANSVVTKDLPPWSICVGIPAKPIKERPSSSILKMEEVLLKKYPQFK